MGKKTGRLRKNRELAFQVLYGISFSQDVDERELKRAFILSPHNLELSEKDLDKEPEGFAWQLVKGVWQNQSKLDEAINHFSSHWRLDRIGRIEHILLSLGLYELLSGITPPKVVMNETLELADQFGAENAKSFINGILDAASRSDDNFLTRS